MSTAKKKSTASASATVTGAFDAVVENFENAADMIKGGVDAALDTGAEQARAAGAFEGVEFVGRENVDAALKSSEAYFAGLKELNEVMVKTAKEAARFHADAAKQLSACKTPDAFAETQMKLASSGFEAVVAAANTFGETATKTATNVAEPFGAPYAKFWPSVTS